MFDRVLFVNRDTIDEEIEEICDQMTSLKIDSNSQ